MLNKIAISMILVILAFVLNQVLDPTLDILYRSVAYVEQEISQISGAPRYATQLSWAVNALSLALVAAAACLAVAELLEQLRAARGRPGSSLTC